MWTGEVEAQLVVNIAFEISKHDEVATAEEAEELVRGYLRDEEGPWAEMGNWGAWTIEAK